MRPLVKPQDDDGGNTKSISREHTVLASRSGLVTDAIESDFKSLDGWRAYLCGAPAMVEALSLIVARLGMASEHVHADAFYPSGV